MTLAGDALAGAAPAGDDRAAVIACVQAGLHALEVGDDAAWREHLETLLRWRARPMVQGLGRLARELHEALGEGTLAHAPSLPDACLRLEHVVQLTEEAVMATLDRVTDCRRLLARLPATADADTHAQLREAFSDITAAQSYQDLTGQVILRVVAVLRALHAGDTPPQADATRGHGPSVAGVDSPAAGQDDADALLRSLGL